MSKLFLAVETKVLRLAEPFRIAGHVFDTSEVIVVTLRRGDRSGRGEASGVFFLQDGVTAMRTAIEEVRPAIEQGVSREALRSLLPPGGARNALDCALWELEAKEAGTPVWQLAGLQAPRPLRTTFTLGADTPDVMAAKARLNTQARSIKIKLTGDPDLDIARVRAIRAARPDVWLGVDGNQGFTRDQLDRLIPQLQAAEVSLIEQPLARGRDDDLADLAAPIPIAGDESLLSLDDLPGAVGRFQVVNIKLDKCGGLTEGLLMAAEARRLGLGVMVGTMVGTSLATAPGFVLGQVCDLVDLDGPTFLAEDHRPGVLYKDGTVWSGEDVWGTPSALSA